MDNQDRPWEDQPPEIDPQALANDGLVTRLQEDLRVMAKKYGFTAIQGIFLKHEVTANEDEGTTRFYVGVGEFFSRYGATRTWCDNIKAEEVHKHMCLGMRRPQ